MTINHIDQDNTSDAEDYGEPDATTVLIDCLCGQRFNPLQLTGVVFDPELTINDYQKPKDGAAFVVFRGACEGDECKRTLELRVAAKKPTKAKAIPPPTT